MRHMQTYCAQQPTTIQSAHLLYVILEFECVMHQLEVPVHRVGPAVRVGAASNWRKVTHKWQVALHRQGHKQLPMFE
jgi:hypothetical protein